MEFRQMRTVSLNNPSRRLKDCCLHQDIPTANRPKKCTHHRLIDHKPSVASSTDRPVLQQPQAPLLEANPQQVYHQPQRDRSPQNRLYELVKQKNRQYFQQLAKVCCTKKPMRNKLDLISVMPSTVYGQDFRHSRPVHNQRVSLPQEPKAKTLDLPNNSIYQGDFPRHPLLPIFKYKRDYQPNNLPFQKHSTYGISHNGARGAPNELQLPKPNIQSIVGLPSYAASTYNKAFDMKRPRPSQPITNQSIVKPIPGTNIPIQTSYNTQFQTWRPDVSRAKHKQLRLLGSDPYGGQWNSQYRQTFMGSRGDHCKPKLVDRFQQIFNS